MEDGIKKTSRLGGRTYSIQGFIQRVIIMLTVLVAISSSVVFFLVYMPLKIELEKSLIENFNQLSFIRYNSLQNNMDRGLEGARSLSSRTMIRNAIIEYKSGKIDMNELITYTQSKYKDGVMALEYLIKSERFVDDTIIAGYISSDYKEHFCTAEDRLVKSNEISYALCLSDDHAYFVMLSPILSEAQVIGYDKLVFDLSGQIRILCTDTIKPEIVYYDEFKKLSSGAAVVQNSGDSSLLYKEGFYYQVFNMQDNTHFVLKQSASSLLDPVRRLSQQTLLVGIGVLLAFTIAIYFLVIQFAKRELLNLEDSRRSLKEALSEANMDPLTKAGCRRFGEEFLTAVFKAFKNGEPSPAIILFDIDSLKQANDMYGHSAGDLVIRSIVEAVQTRIRSGDMLLRWGGDEFIGIFAGLSRENAMSFSRKLLSAVSDLTIETDAGAIRPTISIGISYFNEEDLVFMDAVNRADRAMYQSKSAGKNRVNEV